MNRLPTNADLVRFCEVDGWEPYGTEHIRYRKKLPDGRLLLTKISRGGDRQDVGLLSRILRYQLEVTEQQFWNAVENGIPPERADTELPMETPPALPAWLFDKLRRQVGLTEEEIGRLTEDEARDVLNAHYSKARPDA